MMLKITHLKTPIIIRELSEHPIVAIYGTKEHIVAYAIRKANYPKTIYAWCVGELVSHRLLETIASRKGE